MILSRFANPELPFGLTWAFGLKKRETPGQDNPERSGKGPKNWTIEGHQMPVSQIETYTPIWIPVVRSQVLVRRSASKARVLGLADPQERQGSIDFASKRIGEC